MEHRHTVRERGPLYVMPPVAAAAVAIFFVCVAVVLRIMQREGERGYAIRLNL